MNKKQQNQNKKASKARRGLVILASACLVTLIAIVAALIITSGDNSANAKSNNALSKAVGHAPLANLKIVSVDTPSTFQGMNPAPTKALPGQYLLAITIDYPRDHKDQIRSSEDGEVYLSDASGNHYYTMDTQIPQAEGPGHKPVTQATFVFSVPQSIQTNALTFHYSSFYSGTLPKPKNNGKATTK